MEITYINEIDLNSYTSLRKLAGWREIPLQQAQKGLDNTDYKVAAVNDNGETVGFARMLSDHGYVRYITDVVVSPEYRGQGIGTSMMNMILDYIRATMAKGEIVMICLMAAKGREEFYKRFELKERPNEDYGAGMSLWFRKHEE